MLSVVVAVNGALKVRSLSVGDHITKTYLYNFDPLEPHFYIVKHGLTGVYIIFLISAQKQIVNTG